jgi:hypothetical protein
MDAVYKLFLIVILFVVALFGENLFAGALQNTGISSLMADVISGSCVTYAYIKSLQFAYNKDI